MADAPHIYVDADACPVKAETAKVAIRHGLAVTFVANSGMPLPRGPRLRMQVVSGAFDAADDWIVAQLKADDIVITADIPLASLALKKGARVLGPSGKPFTDDNIGNALATRELMADLRAYGVGGGPPPFTPRDRSRFLQSLEMLVRQSATRP
ncbi:YaiI/YqxD family protein [Wenzhouxiangella sp. XN24]|uniref:YaiI/YqxD family protein n=1 Tax=Wenzhouxiangella sp. XN24 TaxID=2713569 RepID=UPI0013EC426B|nr:YaiI/YqxD family protein [Wenzhouxiangella sp. XN24]